MVWYFLFLLIAGLGLAILWVATRRRELKRLAESLDRLAAAKRSGGHRARLQFPHIDLSRCIGCGTCIRACPEDGVLDLVHGQAVVVHGARCVGHGLCAEACPVEGIALTLADLSNRRDLPALSERFEAPGVPGLFLAGEVTGYALIRTAITHGTTVVEEVARRLSDRPSGDSDDADVFDLCVVGAGPAGLAASLEAKRRGLRFVTLEQETLGGTVSKYPRRKLVMTQPVDLPLHGRLRQTAYTKEELMELWGELAQRHELPIRTGEEFRGLQREGNGFVVQTATQRYRARYVCLALGRRGSPRKLGVPGEELPKVAYSLVDARSYEGRRILVVGGGDSAVEAALGLAAQPGNTVTLSYRKASFFRIKSRNETRLNQAIEEGLIDCLLESHVREITPDRVRLELTGQAGGPTERWIDNDDVFVMIGGVPPFPLLEQCGVSFDPADREAAAPLVEQGTGLLGALWTALVLALGVLAWISSFRSYYAASVIYRPFTDYHQFLRPSSRFGLTCGILATLVIIANLAYLVRRNRLLPLPGSLAVWMTSHVTTGILAFLLVLLHSAMSPRATVGGHALAALGVLVATGAVGRYFYSFAPRAANGAEIALDKLKQDLAKVSAEWDQVGRSFGSQIRSEIESLMSEGQWRTTFWARLMVLARMDQKLARVRERIRSEASAAGLGSDQVAQLEALLVRTYRTAVRAAHYEDVRSLLNSWRFLHRWIALLMVLLAAIHIWAALRYARVLP